MKKTILRLLAAAFFFTAVLPGAALAVPALEGIASPSAVLCDASGKILFQKDGNAPLQPASVTKVMTMLLIMEALDAGTIRLDDMVETSAYAASMGGTQVFLEEGEQMSVDEMLKCITVASANDASVAMAEHLAGTEASFVERMNQRAQELGMNDTTFINANGLDADDERTITSAYDMALASCELLKHPDIKKYTTIWMDTIRNGAFGLANTNKMLKRYNGLTGLKTGFIRNAGYCITASAERDGLELVAVVMAAETKEQRMADATAMLNYGFANFIKIQPNVERSALVVPVEMGKADAVQGRLEAEGGLLLEKEKAAQIEQSIQLELSVQAPVQPGQTIGTLSLTSGGEVVLQIPIVADEEVEALGVFDVFYRMMQRLLMAVK